MLQLRFCCHLSPFLCSLRCSCSAVASMITSLLRSNLSALWDVVRRRSSMRALHRSSCACARFPLLIALQPGHHTVVPNASMSCVVIRPCGIRAPANDISGGGSGTTQSSGSCLSTDHFPSTNRHGTPMKLWNTSMSHLCCGPRLLISRAMNTPSPVST